MQWQLSVDFGTTYTVAAVSTGDGPPEVLEVDGYNRMPSLVMLHPEGRLLAGRAAVNEAGRYPERVERTPKRYIGVTEHLPLGGEMVPVTDAVAAVLERVVVEARRRHNGTFPERLALTHPARWTEGPLECLKAAAVAAGLPAAYMVPEPVAAALAYTEVHLSHGDHVAVYDLGGGTFDTAVLRRERQGFVVAAAPGGNPHLGGEVFDERLLNLLGRQLAEVDGARWEALSAPPDRRWARAHADFLTQVRTAKEQLSDRVDATLYVSAYDRDLLVTREEFESLIRVDLAGSVAELLRTVRSAGRAPEDLAAVYLTGGSSRIPLAAGLVHEQLRQMPATRGDPKSVVALGAIRALTPARADTPPPPPPTSSVNGTVHSGPRPVVLPPMPNFLVPAIISTILCCVPTGVVAIVHAAQVRGKQSAGDIAGAQDSLKKAKAWTWASVGLGVLVALFYLVAMLSDPYQY
ncbi:hypothetical protein GCM10009850_042520 [Nonomuraea monospora]|uniref:Hsp70 protein n=1 Tax=Nonomuraea monospora TaxID=568818 RepID=A0ABN3CH98_9ACTN